MEKLSRTDLISFNLSLATLGLKYCNTTHQVLPKEDFFKNGTSRNYNKHHFKHHSEIYQQNKDKRARKKTIKRYYENNKDKYYSWNAERRNSMMYVYNNLSESEKKAIKKYYEKRDKLNTNSDIKYEVDHIKPLSKGGMHHPDNLQILTMKENRKKYNNIQ